MGLMDAFNPEDRIEITKTEYYNLVKNTASLEEILRAIKNDIPTKYIKTMFNIKDNK